MSALTSPVLGPRGHQAHESFGRAAQRRRAQLQVVPELAAQISQRVFWGVLIAVVLVSITLVLMLNVTLQNQAFELRTLAAQDQQLVNRQAVLEQQLAERSSSDVLAQRAVDLGMVPATAPGFLLLPEGTVLGSPEQAPGAGPYEALRTPVLDPATDTDASAPGDAAPEAVRTPVPAGAAAAETVPPADAAQQEAMTQSAVTGAAEAGPPATTAVAPDQEG